MIKNIVFDMGNVLFTFKPSEYIRRLGYTGRDAEILVTEVFQTAEWCSMDRGTLKPAQAAQILAQRVPEHLKAAVEPLVCHWWEGELMPVPGMGDLVRELKGNGYRIYLLSNASRDIYEYFQRLPAADCFDGLLVSADWLLAKPQHEIYEKLYARFDLIPDECFFVDDRVDNVEVAQLTGMHATVFRGDLSRLRREMGDAGITVRP
ncbi:MAG: HAD family hydrolase [Candidatus Limivicinus sp.]